MPLEQIKELVIKGRRNEIESLVSQALECGVPAREILFEAFIPAMAVVGERFKMNKVFVPEMLMSAATMKKGMDLIEPELLAAGIKPEYKAVLGTVRGDLHDIGKNLVAIMWKGAGFDVVDLGVNVTPQAFVDAVREHQPHLVGLSALLTTTMSAMKETVDAIRNAGFHEVKIMVGGAPISESYARQIEADGYGGDAASAVDVARDLLKHF